ncbi:FkbM family methyltransferase [Nonomuraea sp. NPDC005692]|uniref:FkbM family methyltransferase n=1 Tax=Nonomuraea sp. NPDC005692 TaxID=3157168 RepID=UPI0033C6C435
MRNQTVAPERVSTRWEDHLPDLLDKLGLPAEGAIQVGAHRGQEVEALTRCGFRRLVMMEPNGDHLPALREQLRLHHLAAGLPEPEHGHPAREVVAACAGRERGQATLNVTPYDKQSSMLPPLLPMAVVRQDVVPVIPVSEVQHGCNVLVVDAQGAELEVLAGTDLSRLRLAVVEGSVTARYSGGSTLDSIAEHMTAHGWREVAAWPHLRPGVVDVAWLAPWPTPF